MHSPRRRRGPKAEDQARQERLEGRRQRVEVEPSAWVEADRVVTTAVATLAVATRGVVVKAAPSEAVESAAECAVAATEASSSGWQQGSSLPCVHYHALSGRRRLGVGKRGS